MQLILIPHLAKAANLYFVLFSSHITGLTCRETESVIFPRNDAIQYPGYLVGLEIAVYHVYT